MTTPQSCSDCGEKLHVETPTGLCPRCLLQAGMEPSGEQQPIPLNQPTIDSPSPKDPTAVSTKEEGSQTQPKTVRYFGDYELQEEIGRGGMGVVWRARQVSLNRRVAIKFLAGNLVSEKEVQRFHTEAEAVANLDHPNIVPIFEVGEYQDQHYFSMKLIEGKGLNQCLKSYKGDQRQTAELLILVALAVHHAHQRGILHRDLKPGNILIDQEGQPHITDFGLAKKIEGDTTHLTQSGAVVGTPAYMAPEQARGEKGLSTAVDIYSLGAILFELLTGRTPYVADNPMEMMFQLMEREPPSPRSINPKVNRDLETICLKCLQKDPNKRYGSAESLAEDLQFWLEGKPITARPISQTERVIKWVKRRPGFAALLAGSCTMILLLACISTAFAVANYKNWKSLHKAYDELNENHWDLWQARIDVRNQLVKTRQANQEKDKQLEAARRNLYIGQLLRVGMLWRRDAGFALAILNDETKCPKDLRDFTWGYFHHLCSTTSTKVQASRQKIWSIDFSPDGKLLAVAEENGKVRLWDVKTRKVKRTLEGHPGPVYAVSFSPDGKQLASAGGKYGRMGSGEVLLWEVDSGKQIGSNTDFQSPVYSVTFSPDGKMLATAGEGRISQNHQIKGKGGLRRLALIKAVRLWQLPKMKEVREFIGHPFARSASSVAFGPDGKLLASGSGDPNWNDYKLWDINTGKDLELEEPPLNMHHVGYHSPMNGQCSVVFSPAGKTLFGTDHKSNIHVWELPSHRLVTSFQGHTSHVTALAMSPTGAFLASGSSDRTVRIWDVNTREERIILRGHNYWITSLAFSPDNRTLVSADRGGFLRFWDLKRTPETVSPTGRWRPVAFTREGIPLGLKRSNNISQLVNMHSGEQVRQFESNQRMGKNVFLSAPDKALYAYTYKKEIIIRNLLDDKVYWKIPTQTYFRTPVFSPNGNVIAAYSGNNSIVVWNVKTRREQFRLEKELNFGSRFAFAAGGKLLITWASKKMTPDRVVVQVYDTKTGKKQCDFQGQTEGIAAIALHSSGNQLFTGSRDGSIRMWSLFTGDQLEFQDKGFNTIHILEVSSDGRYLAIVDHEALRGREQKLLKTKGPQEPNLEKYRIKIWDRTKFGSPLLLQGHTNSVTCVAFSPDGKTLASGGEDKTLRLWNIATGQELFSVRHSKDLDRVMFSPDGTILLSQTIDGVVKLWRSTLMQ